MMTRGSLVSMIKIGFSMFAVTSCTRMASTASLNNACVLGPHVPTAIAGMVKQFQHQQLKMMWFNNIETLLVGEDSWQKLVVEDQEYRVRDKLRIGWNIGRSWGSRSQEARGDLGGGRVCWCKQWKMRQGEQRVVQRVVELCGFWGVDDREQRDMTGKKWRFGRTLRILFRVQRECTHPKPAKDASQARLASLQRRRIGNPWCLNLEKVQRSQTCRFCCAFLSRMWRSRWWRG